MLRRSVVRASRQVGHPSRDVASAAAGDAGDVRAQPRAAWLMVWPAGVTASFREACGSLVPTAFGKRSSVLVSDASLLGSFGS